MREFAFLSFYISVLILFRCKSDKTFSVYIDPQRLETRHNNVEPEIKLVPVQQQRVVDVPRYDARLSPVDLLEAAGKVDTTASRGGRWLHDPDIVAEGPMTTRLDLTVAHEDLIAHFGVLLIEVVHELAPLLWQHEGLWDKIEVLLRVLVLHAPHIQAEPVLAGELRACREVVDFLMQIQSLVEVALALGVGPEDVPVMSICLHKAIDLEHESHKL